MRLFLWLFLAAGCDRAFGLEHQADAPPSGDAPQLDAAPIPDLDQDGVPDDVDPCIAPISDGAANSDQDGTVNSMDPCPLHTNVQSDDKDTDGIPDVCDPDNARQDQLRCMMAFSDTTLTDALWRPLNALATYSHLTGDLHCDAACGNGAAESLEAPNAITTYETQLDVSNGVANGGFALWLRKQPDAATSDVGCALFNETGTYTLRIYRGTNQIAAQSYGGVVSQGPVWIRASISPGDPATVTCEASGNGNYTQKVLSTTVARAPGNTAFSSIGWKIDVRGLYITQSL